MELPSLDQSEAVIVLFVLEQAEVVVVLMVEEVEVAGMEVGDNGGHDMRAAETGVNIPDMRMTDTGQSQGYEILSFRGFYHVVFFLVS